MVFIKVFWVRNTRALQLLIGFLKPKNPSQVTKLNPLKGIFLDKNNKKKSA